MKFLEYDEKQGEITLLVENLNDLWSLFNVISEGDHVAARTHRRIVLKEGSKGERKPMRLKLIVEEVSFHEFSNRLRIKGKILEGPDDLVSFGTYHTFNVEINQKLTIKKDTWLKSELNRLKEASKFETNFLILIIAIEVGLATIDLITNFSHNRIARVKKNIPGKRYEQSHRNKTMTEFFEDTKRVIEENVKDNKIDLIIICGPGNTRDLFIKFLKEKSNIINLPRINSIHSSSGTESGILEAIKSNELSNLKEKVKIIQEAEKLEHIFKIISDDTDLIAIGMEEVEKGANQGAVEELFITDKVIRGISKEKKLQVEKIISDVEKIGGRVNILSSEHPTGDQINNLGSILGILRYKL